ncbi:hypothetical protein HDV64DRAFT_251555, partial [Trichoderma sp. TUCIM 5745]
MKILFLYYPSEDNYRYSWKPSCYQTVLFIYQTLCLRSLVVAFYTKVVFQSIQIRTASIVKHIICLIRHLSAASTQNMAQNPDPLDPRIRDKTETCRNKFRECQAHPKLNRQAWLEFGQAEFNAWAIILNASDFSRSPLNCKIRRREEV